MTTTVNPNDYKFEQKTAPQDHIAVTNGTTRTWKQHELVVAKDANNKAYIGFVSTPGGIAASGSGHIDIKQNKEITTNQFTAGAFVAGDTTVHIVIQDNSNEAKINQASAVGRFALNALIISYDASGVIRLRMPNQEGIIIATV
jgi:hypothetical protein